MRTIDSDNLPYRACVGVALFNQDGKVFLGKRTIDDGTWAMPQTGIQDGETVMMAARRELSTALGIRDVRMLSVAPEWLSFDYPTYLIPKVHNGLYRGQMQKWVAAHFLGNSHDINILASGKQEFSLWRWEDFSSVSGVVVPYKRHLYRNVQELFKKHARPMSLSVREMAEASMETTRKTETKKQPKPTVDNKIVHMHEERQRRAS